MGEWGKRAAKMVLQRLLMKALGALWSSTWPYILGIGAILIICIVAYYAIFELPKEAILGTATDPTQAFFSGTKEEQSDVLEDYQTVAARWNEDLNDHQLSQVDPYELPWGWLAIMDRTLNDPQFIKTYDPEAEVMEQKNFIPKPEEMFEEVRPLFTWETREEKTVEQICVAVGGGVNGATQKSYVVKERTTIVNKELLMKANTMQNEFVYAYEPSINTSKKTKSSKCGKLTKTVYWFAVTSVETTKKDWEPMQELLVKRNVIEKDQKFLMDYWMEYLVADESEGGFLPDDSWSPVAGGTLLWPVPASHRITSSFGVRIHPITGVRKMHNGVDIGAPQGTTVLASADGTVVYAAAMGNAGNAVILQHENGMQTRYYHLFRINVKSGQEVQSGQTIGEVGTTGSSTGPHLHFEVRTSGNPVDPMDFFGYTGDPLKYRALHIAAIQQWLQARNSALANVKTLKMIDAAGKAKNVDPHLLLAITGAEQSFVPASHPQASRIIRNPWNVFGSWSTGKGSTLTTGESARIAANTIIKLSKGRPSQVNPIEWLSSRDNPSGYYAGDGDNWTRNVSALYDQLSKMK